MTPRSRLLLAAAVAVLVPVAGVLAYTNGPTHQRHDPQASLQQLDLLYLDEPAPGVRSTGRPQLLVFCRACTPPDLVRADVRVLDDPALARQYGLGAPGRIGYALVDADGDVRYRTYDPGLGRHRKEIQTLVDGLSR